MILKPGFLTASLRILSTGLGFHKPERGSRLIWGDNGAHARLMRPALVAASLQWEKKSWFLPLSFLRDPHRVFGLNATSNHMYNQDRYLSFSFSNCPFIHVTYF